MNIDNEINGMTLELNHVNDDKDKCKHEARALQAKLTAEEEEYQSSVRTFNEEYAKMEAVKARMEVARAKMEVANEKKNKSNKMRQSNDDNYNMLIRKENYLRRRIQNKEIDLRVLRESLELEKKINACRKEEKQVVKKVKKNGDIDDTLLKKIQKMPQDIILLIHRYLSYDVRISLIKDSFNRVMNKCKGGKSAPQNYESMGANAPILFVSLLNYAATCPEFLPLLSREEARLQIPSLTPSEYDWRVYTYCKPRSSLFSGIFTFGNLSKISVSNFLFGLVIISK